MFPLSNQQLGVIHRGVDWHHFRDETGLTGKQMAALFRVSRPSIVRWLNGTYSPRGNEALLAQKYLDGELVIAWTPDPTFYPPDQVPTDAGEIIGMAAAFLGDPVERVLDMLEELDPEQRTRVLAHQNAVSAAIAEKSDDELARALALIHTRAMSNPQVSLSSEEDTVQLNVRVVRSLRERVKAEAKRRGVSEAVYVRSLLSVAVPAANREL